MIVNLIAFSIIGRLNNCKTMSVLMPIGIHMWIDVTVKVNISGQLLHLLHLLDR